jgi:hypothetical protein
MDDSSIFDFDEDVTTWDFWRRDSDENLLDVAIDDSREERRTVFLFFAMTELIFRIRAAQELNLLPRAIPPRKYSAWLSFVRIPSPAAISILFTRRVDSLSVGGDTFQTSHGSNEKERGCYQQRVDNNLLKIILALLLMTPGQELIDIADLAKAIEDRLDELDREVNPGEGKSLTVKAPTIAKHLKKVGKLTEASDELYFKTDNN